MAKEQLHAIGKRKTAVARIYLRPGTGQFMINKRPFEQYLLRDADRSLAKEPLVLTDMANRFDIYANVRGGGIAGQAGAIRHGVSRALLIVNPELREQLKRAGLLTRDSRMKERKKYGLRSARARFQYSKR